MANNTPRRGKSTSGAQAMNGGGAEIVDQTAGKRSPNCVDRQKRTPKEAKAPRAATTLGQLVREIRSMRQAQQESIALVKQMESRLIILDLQSARIYDDVRRFIQHAQAVLSTKIGELFSLRKAFQSLLTQRGVVQKGAAQSSSMSNSYQALIRNGSSTPINRAASRGLKGE